MNEAPADGDRFPLPLRVAVLYAIAGGLWVFATDRVVELLFPTSVAMAQTVKGVLFVGGSALLIFTLVSRELRTRNRTERALGRTRRAHGHLSRRMETLVVSAPVAIVELDASGRIVTWNPAAERLFGWAEEDVIGREPPIIPADRRREFEDLRIRALGGASVEDVETLRLHRDGHEIPVALSVAPVGDGDAESTIAVLVDLTVRKRLEAQLMEAQRMETLGLLASGLAHDLNNMLTAILVHVDLAVMSESGRLGPRAVQDIRLAATCAAGLTDRLLTLSRRRGGQPVDVDLTSTIEGLKELLARLLGDRAGLAVDLPDHPVVVRANRGQIEQVLLNLVTNARDALPDGGQVCIALDGDPEGRARLVVSDDGPGIDPELAEEVFQPFFTTKDGDRNTGLGLATVRMVVEDVGGTIDLRSEPGAGATFCIRLPLGEETDAVPADTFAPPGPRTLLLVEDEPAVRNVVQAILERAGYQVLTAACTADAEAALEGRDGDVDVLVTDVVLPDGRGDDLADRLRGRHPELRVLYVGGSPRPANAGGAPVLEKPFGSRELLGKLHQVLEPA